MRDEELWKKRVIPCLNEMYTKAETFFGIPITFEMTNLYAPWGESFNGKKERKSVYGCFYLSTDDYKKIMEKYTKGFRTYWRFPYQSENFKEGEEFEELKKAYETEPENQEIKEEYEWTLECMRREKLWEEYCTQLEAIWKDFNEKKITLKEAHKREAKLSQEYGCQKRSRDKERVEFTIMDFSPNSNKEYYELVKKYYSMDEQLLQLVGENISDVNKHAIEDAKLAKAFINNVKTKNKTVNEQSI